MITDCSVLSGCSPRKLPELVERHGAARTTSKGTRIATNVTDQQHWQHILGEGAAMADPAVLDPRLLINTARAVAAAPDGSAGAVWRLGVEERDLDANVIALPPGERIERHFGPDLDVMLHVIRGSGQLIMEAGVLELHPGDLVWLPRRSERQITAGSDGLHYLTVHRRRQALVLDPPAARSAD